MSTPSRRSLRLPGVRLPHVLRAVGIAAVLLVCGSRAALAADPASRVARLSDFSGAVSFAPAGSDDWAGATLNRPFTTGDRLWSDQGSRSELHVGSTALRLGQNTGATLVDLDDRNTQVKLTQGALSVRVRALPPDQTIEIDTPNLAFRPQAPGEYRLDVAPDGSSTTVTVWHGQGTAYGDDRSTPLGAGQQIRFGGTDLAEAGGMDNPGRDGFDRWAESRDAREDASISARYVGREMTGYEALDGYGSWREEDGYGAVWVPSAIPAGWAPYRTGHWAWVAPWGWTWVDDQPWGFAPFHYGRWAYVGATWCWVPGPVVPRPVYAPALVGFVGGGGGGGVSWGINISIGSPGVAWFPLAPGEAYRPVYAASPTYVTNINKTVVVNNVTVNKTIINNNVTNITNVNRVTYVNANNPAALTAVPAKTFVSGQPVGPAMTTLRPEQMRAQLAHARIVSTPALAPVKASLVGAAAANGAHPLPPAQVFSRQAIAVRAPQAPAGGHDALAERFHSQGGALPGAGPAWTGGNAGARVAPVRGQPNEATLPAPAAAQAAGLRLTRAASNEPTRAGNEPGRPPEQHGPSGVNSPNGPQGLMGSPNPQGAQAPHGAQPGAGPQALMAPGTINRPRPLPGAAAPQERPGQPQAGQAPQGPAGMTTRPPQHDGAPGTPRDERRAFEPRPQLPQTATQAPQPQPQRGGQEPNRFTGNPAPAMQERPHNEPPQMRARPEPEQRPPVQHMEAPRPAPQPHVVEMRPPQPQPQPRAPEFHPPQPQPQQRPPEARPPQPQPQAQPPHQEHHEGQPHPQGGNRGEEKHEEHH
ncbi:hypothetical protein PQH03_15955 [Ralstonia insidiosa]|uniref:DUF6600 domain-containing protein n=2 Tax=Pseudomonadota TaxID=1224 RepID=UPI000664A7F8|nr:DUF6600 domain-containing protein [Ralstonia insidiosa]KMW44492.1 membrane protein [Ralstonia sp. MD27]MBX3773317.1 hypothetical protein [Ralstonia pickettii]NOZ98769.1 hypothetical protein [Betaproteobacteria bacterium]MBA9858418.1 hypothetical protein [Ralstonia insidiosa]MBA9872329.1 hypothetical protein [Ralstonia insidiosa]